MSDADLVRRALGILGSAPETPAAMALDRMVRALERYEWVRPLVTGEDDPDGKYKMFRLGAALLRGKTGEAAVVDAMST